MFSSNHLYILQRTGCFLFWFRFPTTGPIFATAITNRRKVTTTIIHGHNNNTIFGTTKLKGEVQVLAIGSDETRTEETNMTTIKDTTVFVKSVWDGSDEDGFNSLNHPGYSIESNSNNHHTGGWHAYREVWTKSKSNDENNQQTSSSDGNDDDDDGADHSNSTCWVREIIEDVTKFDYKSMEIGRPPKILVLYGSLRPNSFSRKCAYEFARLLDLLGCDVRVYNPRGLPVRDPAFENEAKVIELRALTHWSDGHMWVSPEMHGTITGTFKNQIDWIPLNTGSVRPTQGKTCCVAQVNGGSQSFNAVNALRLLARWMRMPCCTNQSSVAKAWKEFDDSGRMKESSFRERVVDVAEEFAKFTAVMAPIKESLTNRYSERKEKLNKGRLLTQAEKEKETMIEKSRK